MPPTNPNEDYLSFMEWFKKNHAELHYKYWRYITIAKNGEGIRVVGTDLDPDVFSTLTQLEYDYYHPEG